MCLEVTLIAHRVTRITGCHGVDRESAAAYWLVTDSGLRCSTRTGFSRAELGGGKVHEIETGTKDSSNNQILFPMAVGVLFLVVLVAGALLG